ncbi:type II toxin-antitoxin system VapB family antitoxin [Microbispora siamensis]|uniref:type II toxin-antitoxin system VapB family antitoxin n=1 Tax=Microbispora siamensis TaxID=564413 RepID=UPI00194E1F51|nr:type II toxin-antitoxin system VapB family antitoxin [Microbispora siamensis]
MSLNIKNPEAERLAAEIGALTGESKTAAVVSALRERHERLLAKLQQTEDASMAEDILALAAKIRSRVGELELSSDFLYDPETGLPS